MGLITQIFIFPKMKISLLFSKEKGNMSSPSLFNWTESFNYHEELRFYRDKYVSLGIYLKESLIFPEELLQIIRFYICLRIPKEIQIPKNPTDYVPFFRCNIDNSTIRQIEYFNLRCTIDCNGLFHFLFSPVKRCAICICVIHSRQESHYKLNFRRYPIDIDYYFHNDCLYNFGIFPTNKKGIDMAGKALKGDLILFNSGSYVNEYYLSYIP